MVQARVVYSETLIYNKDILINIIKIIIILT